ncbi:uncharacterized protein LOC130665662 isoform X3 [Microplitis mediator]|uniref:uncharacterized protein LOC130665662 isoform X3 n=1 Tax=Microplitis mediator TaxID=375433 RepID=UPI00255433C9|nr:uncharacterized protein LOC130665662 isoform X3 [Microplitis mediator]
MRFGRNLFENKLFDVCADKSEVGYRGDSDLAKFDKSLSNVISKFECGNRVKFIFIKKKNSDLLCASTSGPGLVRRLHLPGGMVLWAAMLVLYGVGFVGSMTGVPGVPENVTVMFLSPTSVRVSWSTSQVDQVEKYDVTYKPTDARNFTNDRNETIDDYDQRKIFSYNETYNETFILSYNEPYNETYDDDDDDIYDKSYRMVRLVAGNSDAVTLNDLQADTQYQLVITAVRAGKKYRSRPIVFRTLEPPRTSPQQDASVTGGPPIPPPPSSSNNPHQAHIQVRGVEVGIVVMVLIVWAGAIALFFNRWGKIRMLLPYQPDYKEQLKVPGTGAVCAPSNTTCTQHSSQHACSQHLHWSNHRVDSLDSATGGGGAAGGGSQGWPRSSRPRVNSAIDVAGFLSQEFLRRHGSTSRLCRKVRSADNLPLVTESSNHQDNDNDDDNDNDNDDEERCQRNSIPSQDDGNETDRETFLPLTMTTTITTTTETNQDEQDDKTDDFQSKKIINYSDTRLLRENTPGGSVTESFSQPQQNSSREFISSSTITTAIPSPSLIVRRFSGWRISGSHEYVRCPIRQPSSIDDRRSCEPDFPRSSQAHHHHHHHHHLPYKPSTSNGNPVVYHPSSDSDQSRQTSVSSVEIQHFGLPILSVSEPSPPDEKNNRLDDYL